MTALDPHARRVLDMITAASATGADGPRNFSAEAVRHSMAQLARACDVRSVAVDSVEDRAIPRSEHPIPVRIYTPCGIGTQTTPVIVYFHGGMGVFGSIATHDGLCRTLASTSGCRVISVEYRLAPEHPFPAAIEDGSCAAAWIADHADELRVDRDRLVVAGDSAGGTIAAAICQCAAPAVALQVLLCPVTDVAGESESRRTFGDGYFIDRAMFEWATASYRAGADISDPRVSPLRASSLVGLPPAHIHTAEFDPMRDEGAAYACALASAGVPVRYVCHAGLIHHFYCMGGVIPRARAALACIGAEIRQSVIA